MAVRERVQAAIAIVTEEMIFETVNAKAIAEKNGEDVDVFDCLNSVLKDHAKWATRLDELLRELDCEIRECESQQAI